MAYIIGGGDQAQDREPPDMAREKARTAKPEKGGPRVAGKKQGAKRWACWQCGSPMAKKGLVCKRCRKTRPAAVKSQLTVLTKSRGAPVRPVSVPSPKAPKPRCPNPACAAKGGRKANACSGCGTPFGQVHAMRAEKAARRMQLSIAGSQAYWEAEAMRQHDPAEREACFAEARKALQARGAENSALVPLLVKSSGASSVREAWLRQSDPHAREVLRAAFYGEGGRPA